jgi:hypothetical protein
MIDAFLAALGPHTVPYQTLDATEEVGSIHILFYGVMVRRREAKTVIVI